MAALTQIVVARATPPHESSLRQTTLERPGTLTAGKLGRWCHEFDQGPVLPAATNDDGRGALECGLDGLGGATSILAGNCKSVIDLNDRVPFIRSPEYLIRFMNGQVRRELLQFPEPTQTHITTRTHGHKGVHSLIHVNDVRVPGPILRSVR